MVNSNSHESSNLQMAQPSHSIENGLKEWHRIVAALDWDALPALLTDEVLFRNPVALEPYQGKATMVTILKAVFGVLEDFTYLRQFHNAAGYVLEFQARVGSEVLFGVDLIEFNQDGKIQDFAIMMRPANTVLTLAAEAGKRLASSQGSAEQA